MQSCPEYSASLT